jgi:hypothetical protein
MLGADDGSKLEIMKKAFLHTRVVTPAKCSALVTVGETAEHEPSRIYVASSAISFISR